MRKALAALLLAAAGGGAAAQAVTLQGMLGNKALLIVDGAAPRAVAPGESVGPVKVLSTAGDQAVLEIEGRKLTLRVGDAPASVGGGGAGGRGNKIVIPAGSGGHFFTQGTINGKSVQFMVDTGATVIAMGLSDAQRLGIDYTKGTRVNMSTANGIVPTYRIKLASVRIGDVELYEIDASVLPMAMGGHLLLGNSFLSRFQMRRDNDQLVLERRF